MSKKEILGFLLLPVGVGALFIAIGALSRGVHLHGGVMLAVALPAIAGAWHTLRGS